MDNIPKFPAFRSLTLEDKQWFDLFNSTLTPYADLSFNNLYIWFADEKSIEISRIAKFILIRTKNPFISDQELMHLIIGSGDIDVIVIPLKKYFAELNIEPMLSMVTEEIAQALSPYAELTLDLNNSEYILDVAKITHLAGSDMRSLREDCNAFVRHYGETIRYETVLLDSSGVKRIINSLHTWDCIYSENDINQHESNALKQILLNPIQLDYKCFTILSGDTPIAFVLYHFPPQHDFAMPNIIKVNRHFEDVYDYTVFAFANHVDGHGKKYINFEQDLGIPGLRYYKQSLRPIYMLNKFTVKLV